MLSPFHAPDGCFPCLLKMNGGVQAVVNIAANISTNKGSTKGEREGRSKEAADDEDDPEEEVDETASCAKKQTGSKSRSNKEAGGERKKYREREPIKMPQSPPVLPFPSATSDFRVASPLARLHRVCPSFG